MTVTTETAYLCIVGWLFDSVVFVQEHYAHSLQMENNILCDFEMNSRVSMVVK